MKTKSTIFLPLFFALVILSNNSKAQAVNVQDSLALVDLYNSTNGPGWTDHTGWLNEPVKNWFGILTIIDSRVLQIYLPNNNLSGNIPFSLSSLTNLALLNLNSNQLTGSIPPSLGNFAYMIDLEFASNQLTGSIPRELENLGINKSSTSITVDLSNNQLTGSIPSELGNIEFLDRLYLSHNLLTGTIPASLGSLPYLFSGLDLSYNSISGSIPSELGNLVNFHSSFNLSHNQLTGSIPASFSNFAGFGIVDLSYNLLSGNIPSTLGNNPIYDIYLNNNNLEGNIPASLAKIWGSVNLSYNNLTGSIPSEFGSAQFLYKIDFSHNQLSGKIPEFSRDNYFNIIYVNDNNLNGKIPASIKNITYLANLDLSHNRIWGKIPASLSTKPLIELNLSYNKFSFEGMELIAQTFPFAVYNKQKPIPIHLNNNILSVFAGGTLSNNTYHWYGVRKNGYASEIISGDSVFHPAKSGIYFVRVFNSVATELTLRSDTIYYNVPIANVSSKNALQADDNKNIFLVYPNPAKDILHVQTNSNASFSLLNQNGKILLTTNINGSGTINVSNIAAGIYYLRNNGNGEVRKIVLER